MKGFVFRLVITGLGLWAAETIVPGVRIDGWGNLVLAALLVGKPETHLGLVEGADLLPGLKTRLLGIRRSGDHTFLRYGILPR